MLRRRYHAKKEAVGKAKGRQKAHAAVRHCAGALRGVYRCTEDGFLIYRADGEYSFPWPVYECLCFTGHRSIPEKDRETLRERLAEALEAFYQRGKRVFLSGGALGFDTLAAQAVERLRDEHPDVKMVIAVPCRSQASRWSAADRKVYEKLLAAADEVVYVSEDYFPGCMQKRNRFLVSHADTCLCYLTHCRGGTWNTVSMAYDLKRKIVNLAAENQWS